MLSAARPRWVERLDELHLLVPLRLLAVVVGAWLAAWFVRRWVGRAVNRLIGAATTAERSASRGRSLASALRSAAVATIWIVAAIAVLDELGFDVSGVVVTATVIGGALAFGAQTLVRDVISGVFVLSEDQYAVGDLVDVGVIGGAGPIVGAVERVTLRSTRLRDDEGRIWHVPNGAVQRVANLSQSSLAVLDATLDAGSDLDDARRVLRGLGDELVADGRVGALCTGRYVEFGVTTLEGDRLVHRSTIGTLAGRQDDVQRVWRELLAGAYRDGRLTAPG